MTNALDLCNCCEMEPSAPSSRAGYCFGCEEAAHKEEVCGHDEE